MVSPNVVGVPSVTVNLSSTAHAHWTPAIRKSSRSSSHVVMCLSRIIVIMVISCRYCSVARIYFASELLALVPFSVTTVMSRGYPSQSFACTLSLKVVRPKTRLM